MSRNVGQLRGSWGHSGRVWDGEGGGGCSARLRRRLWSTVEWSVQPNPPDSRVHWVTLVEEALSEPFTAVTCTANLLPASR